MPRRGWARHGGVLVEMALVIPVLITMMFGMLEFGFIFSDQTMLTHASREATRVASLGGTNEQIGAAVASARGPLRTSKLATPLLRYRVWNGSTWGDWQTLTSTSAGNCAQSGDQVSVRLQYTHDLMTGPWLVPLFSGHRSVTLTSQIVMRRE
jgi:Flp pilus assembly protein TadG